MLKKITNVGMCETQISSDVNEQLIAIGLGSCIGLIMYDTKQKIAGMAHLVLPESKIATDTNYLPGKFVDTGFYYLFKKILEQGADKNNVIVSIAGGSQMFSFTKSKNVLNIGLRNIVAVKALISKENMKLAIQNTGGNKGRTMSIDVETGTVSIQSIGNIDNILGENYAKNLDCR